MQFFHRRQNRPYAAAGLIAALFVVLSSASCGSKKGGNILDGENGNMPGNDDGGGSSSGCTGFGSCTGSSSGGLPTDGGFVNNSDSGVVNVMPVNGKVTDSNCPGALSKANVTALQGAKANSASLKWLYPYNATIFPGGLPAPILQWSQTGTPAGVYVHMTSKNFEYTGCFSGSNPPQLQLDAKEWATAYAQSGGKADPLTIQLSTISGSTVSGPITETWTFAKGNLAGVVYYNTYGSQLVPGQTGQNGAVMRIDKGATQPTPFLYTTGTSVFPFGPCVSCHALSADGSTLVAQQHFYPNPDPLNGKGSMSFDLAKTAKPDPTAPMASTLDDDWGFGAVYPDGTLVLTSGEASDTTQTPLFPGAKYNNPGMIGPKPASLYDLKTAAVYPTTGLTSPYAMMPMFSTDGKHVVYTEAPAADAGTPGGHTLVVMDFDKGTKVFSNPKRIYHDDMKYPGWPFFTPDALQVIFALGDANADNFASELPPTGNPLNNSQIYVVSSAGGGTAHRLDQLSGFDSAGNNYLPNGTKDTNVDYYPTTNPVSSGGYFWAYFTSRRAYGNLYDKGSADIGSKALWVSAIDIGTTSGDPSHPAFYLPGQELGSGNLRAFSVLPLCKGEGTDCESGIDCCMGTCTTGKCGPPMTCAGEGDRCTDSIPCCNPVDQCLGGYCGFISR